MEKKVIECSKCGYKQFHKCNSINEVIRKTGFELIDVGVWLCPNCLKDKYEAEGC